MLVIALASQKGGSGKTTLSGHLAVEAEKAGAGPVALVDTDPQGSLAAWWNVRTEKTPAFAKVGVFDLQSAMEQLKASGIKLVVIDTPPAITDAISHVISLADLILVPCRPSPHDLRSVGATADLADRHKKPLIFIVNAATPRARITGEAAVALSQHGTVAPITIHHRVDFAASMVDGRTVGEVIPDSPSAKEVTELWIYIQDRLARLAKDPTLAPEARPDYFSISSLSGGSEMVDAVDHASQPEDMQALSTKLREAYTPPAPASAPVAELARSETAPSTAYHASAATQPAQAAQSAEVQRPEFGARKALPKPRDAARGTLFGGAGRQTNTFGRRNWD
jgi:chromosome partitioning protein